MLISPEDKKAPDQITILVNINFMLRYLSNGSKVSNENLIYVLSHYIFNAAVRDLFMGRQYI